MKADAWITPAGLPSLAAFLLSLAFFAGCGAPTAPTPPSAPRLFESPPPQVPTPTPSSSAASVVIEDAWATVRRPTATDRNYGFGTRFLLRETSGKSGATILSVVVSSPNGSDETGPGCWLETLRVPPGATLDIFYTDEGARWLVYCAPGTGERTAVSQVGLIVSFADDEGRRGSVQAVAIVRE